MSAHGQGPLAPLAPGVVSGKTGLDDSRRDVLHDQLWPADAERCLGAEFQRARIPPDDGETGAPTSFLPHARGRACPGLDPGMKEEARRIRSADVQTRTNRARSSAAARADQYRIFRFELHTAGRLNLLPPRFLRRIDRSVQRLDPPLPPPIAPGRE